MKSLKCALIVLMQLSYFFLGTSFQIQYKCPLWDSPCLTANARALLPTLTAGIPALGIERLDTMFIDSLHIDKDGYRADWDNIYVQSLRNTIIDKLSIDTNSKVMRLLFHTDLSVKAHYVNGGFLLFVPIAGDGEVTMNLRNVQMEFVIPYDIKKDVLGRDIMNLKGYQYWYDVKDGADMHFGDLYYGNYDLSRKMHTLIKQNWKLLTLKYGRFLFDKINDKIFNAMRTYLHSRPLDVVTVY